MRKRRTFSGQFKAQVVLEVLTGVKSATQVRREHDIKETVGFPGRPDNRCQSVASAPS